MKGLFSFLTRDPLTAFLGEYNINRNNPRRCDLINRSRLVNYFDISDPHGCEALTKVIDMASKPSTTSIVRLKYVMLLHSLIVSSNLFYDFILDNEIVIPKSKFEELPAIADKTDKVQKNGKHQKPSVDKAVAGWIENAVQLYYTYVLKICMHKEIYQECKVRLRYPTDWPETINTIYMLINLVKSAFPMKQFILNIGRYFSDEYLVVADVNRILAVDLVRTYNSISFMADELLKDYETKLTRQQCKQLLNIIDQIFLVHEDLYIMLYNRYYFGCMEVLSPYWFKIDGKDYEAIKGFAENKVNTKRKNVTMLDLDIDIYQFEKTYFQKNTRKYSEELPELQV